MMFELSGLSEYITSSKPRNSETLPAKVQRRVFASVDDAKEYCKTHGLDPSTSIESGNSEELKSEIQEIAKNQSAILQAVIEMIDSRKEAISLGLDYYHANLETCRPLNKGYYKKKLYEISSSLTEWSDMSGMIYDLMQTLDLLSGELGVDGYGPSIREEMVKLLFSYDEMEKIQNVSKLCS